MSKFRVQRKATVWVEITIEADTEDEAVAIGESDESLWEFGEEIPESFSWYDLAGLWVSGKKGD